MGPTSRELLPQKEQVVMRRPRNPPPPPPPEDCWPEPPALGGCWPEPEPEPPLPVPPPPPLVVPPPPLPVRLLLAISRNSPFLLSRTRGRPGRIVVARVAHTRVGVCVRVARVSVGPPPLPAYCKRAGPIRNAPPMFRHRNSAAEDSSSVPAGKGGVRRTRPLPFRALSNAGPCGLDTLRAASPVRSRRVHYTRASRAGSDRTFRRDKALGYRS